MEKSQKIQFNESQPLYTDNGWYCVFQKDIVLFDKKLMEETIQFYRKIINASAYHQKYLKVKSPSQDDQKLYTIQDDFFESLDSAYNQIPFLLTKFGR